MEEGCFFFFIIFKKDFVVSNICEIKHAGDKMTDSGSSWSTLNCLCL